MLALLVRKSKSLVAETPHTAKEMVVVHAQPSTSTGPRKKNRRRTSKKNSQDHADNQPQNDTKMDEEAAQTEVAEAAKDRKSVV